MRAEQMSKDDIYLDRLTAADGLGHAPRDGLSVLHIQGDCSEGCVHGADSNINAAGLLRSSPPGMGSYDRSLHCIVLLQVEDLAGLCS